MTASDAQRSRRDGMYLPVSRPSPCEDWCIISNSDRPAQGGIFNFFSRRVARPVLGGAPVDGHACAGVEETLFQVSAREETGPLALADVHLAIRAERGGRLFAERVGNKTTRTEGGEIWYNTCL